MVNFIKQYWKLLLALIYAVFVPLYFYNYNANMQKAIDFTRTSSNNQISLLQNHIDEQKEHYDSLIEEYKLQIEEEEIRYQEEISKIKETQEKQQKILAKRFKENPSDISKELYERYGLSDK